MKKNGYGIIFLLFLILVLVGCRPVKNTVTSIVLNENKEVIITYSNGTNENLGSIIGEKGEVGLDGSSGVGIKEIIINLEGELMIKLDDNTEINLGLIFGKDGKTPFIGENGNWWIGSTDLGVPVTGENGFNGKTPYIGENGNWWIDDVDLEVSAKGENGKAPYIGENGNWWIGDIDQGIPSTGSSGLNGLSAYEIYLLYNENYEGTEEEWILDLVNGNLKDKQLFYVDFIIDGETVETQKIEIYGKAKKPENPEKLGYVFKGWYIEDEPWFFHSNLVTESIELTAKFEMENFNLPILNIEIPGTYIDDVNREVYNEATFSITNTHDKYLLDNISGEIRGRGNGSWQFDKKGYRIKLSTKTSLFGVSESRHWAIVAEGHDLSSMRHNIAYTIVNKNLNNIEYTTSVNIVEVYINNEYRGVYSLFEHNRVEEGRIDIESDHGILDTGYLVEYDAYSESEGSEGIDYFRIDGLKYPFSVKSPDTDDYIKKGMTEEEFRIQIIYIKNYIQEAFNILETNDITKFEEYFDIVSFVDMYIIHEFMKNSDTGWSSFYIYKKKGGKLFAGPAWDFDLSSGINYGDKSHEGLYHNREGTGAHTNMFFVKMMSNGDFENMVKNRFLELFNDLNETIDYTFEQIKNYTKSYERNSIRWNDRDLINWENHQKFLYHWLIKRLGWMQLWASNKLDI